MATTNQTTIRSTFRARRGLKLIAAATQEKQYEVLDRLVEAELKARKLKLPVAYDLP